MIWFFNNQSTSRKKINWDNYNLTIFYGMDADLWSLSLWII